MLDLVSPLRVLTPLPTTACSHIIVARMNTAERMNARVNEFQFTSFQDTRHLGRTMDFHSLDNSIQEL